MLVAFSASAQERSNGVERLDFRSVALRDEEVGDESPRERRRRSLSSFVKNRLAWIAAASLTRAQTPRGPHEARLGDLLEALGLLSRSRRLPAAARNLRRARGLRRRRTQS